MIIENEHSSLIESSQELKCKRAKMSHQTLISTKFFSSHPSMERREKRWEEDGQNC